MKYIIYTRKSTEDDNKQVLSIEAQFAELREFAAKEKLEIVGPTFVETKTAKKPEKYRLEPHFVKEIFSLLFVTEILGNFCFFVFTLAFSLYLT